mmetsp:Transcript_40872/g.49083  ORF Transcript_40872/g.49083 Transcript_40872/m.49083 type:complete len:246 (+) Transcript_40872:152-889(+)
MKYFSSIVVLAASASAFTPAMQGQKTTMSVASAKVELESMATKLNPVINFYDPMNLAEMDFYDQGNDATIGFLRHAEIKHGRVAMAAFVGYIVQSNVVFPWAQTLAGDPFPSPSIGPEAQWDAIPELAKWQIFLLIGALEFWDEFTGDHYMRGRTAGKYPSFQPFRDNVHFVLDLYDPLGFNKKMSDEKKEKRLLMEVNNGRLAMLGIFGFLSADAVPGSVPLLGDIAVPYAGNVMAPFNANFHI